MLFASARIRHGGICIQLQYSMSEQICKTERSPPPLEHETLTPSFPCVRLLLQSSRQEKTEKREENGLTFAGEGVYCCLETGSAFACGAGSELISSYISAKEIVNRPSFNLKNLLPLNRNMPARDQCVFRLAGRFSVVQWQVLGRTYDFTYGNRPAFFMFGRFRE